MRKLFAALCLMLASAAATAQSFDNLSDTDRKLLHAEIRQYLLENPEILLEVIDLLEERQANQQAADDVALIDANRDQLENDGYSFIAGNPEGALTIIEFSDYQCGYCKRAHPDVKALLEQRDDVRLVLKEFPILGPASETAALAALAVLESEGPEVYEGFNDAMMTHSGRLSDEIIDLIATNQGIDVARMREAMASDEIKGRVAANLELAQAIRASGTPTFVIGDRILRGYLPLEDMLTIVDGELAKM